jgi:hypothetical protein
MAGITAIITAIGVGASVAGTVAGVVGQARASRAAKRAEELRERQMNLEAARQRRAEFRNVIKSRASIISNATQAGAEQGSGLPGGVGSTTAQGLSNVQAINQNQQIGQGIFAANRDSFSGRSLASFGAGLVSLGGMAISNAPAFSRFRRNDPNDP